MVIERKMTLIGARGRRVIDVVVDTGASRTVVNSEIAEAVGLPLSDERKSFLDANGNGMESIGGKLALRYAGRTYAIYGFISKTLSNNCLLGMDFLTRYDVRIDARSGRLHFK